MTSSFRLGCFSLIALFSAGSPAAQSVEPEESWGGGSTLPGVVVEAVPEPTVLAKAGIQPGDILLTWQRLPNPPANPEPAEGVLDSPFDFHDFRLEQAPRGTAEVLGTREGIVKRWRIEPGSWLDVEVRPVWTEEYLGLYLQGQQQIEKGKPQAGEKAWRRLADRLGQENADRQRLWMRFKLARFRIGSDHEQPQTLDSTDLFRSSTVRRLDSAYAQLELAGIFMDRGYLKQAHDLYGRALEIQQSLAPQSLRPAYSLIGLGTLASHRGDLKQAKELCRQALEIFEELAPRSLPVAISLHNLAVVASERGNLERAQDLLTSALKIQQELAPGSLEVAPSLHNLAVFASERGDLEQAQELQARALKIQQELAPGSRGVAASLQRLGQMAIVRGDLERNSSPRPVFRIPS